MSDLNVLTAADITALLSNTRVRGGMEAYIRSFVDSGEMYRVVNEAPQYKEKTKEQLVSVKNQMVMKAKALELHSVKLVKKGDSIIIVNTDLLNAEVDPED